MSIPTYAWFVIAAVALGLGLLLLRAEARLSGMPSRDRRRWAAEQEWEYLDSDPVLPSRWRYGTIHQGGPGVARNLVTGSVPTPEGRRLVYVFDHEQASRLSSVIVAVQRRSTLSGAFELRLPSAPLPDDAGLDLLEPVGQRYAFVTDAALVRPLLTDRLVAAADAVGEDIELLWAEESWVLCTAPLDYGSDQLRELLDQLVEVASALEEAARSDSGPSALPASPTQAFSGSSAATWARTLSGRVEEVEEQEQVEEPEEVEDAAEAEAEEAPADSYWERRGQASAGWARSNRLGLRPRPTPRNDGLSPEERSAASRAAAERAAAERAAAEQAALDRAAASKSRSQADDGGDQDGLDSIGFGKGAGNGSGA